MGWPGKVTVITKNLPGFFVFNAIAVTKCKLYPVSAVRIPNRAALSKTIPTGVIGCS